MTSPSPTTTRWVLRGQIYPSVPNDTERQSLTRGRGPLTRRSRDPSTQGSYWELLHQTLFHLFEGSKGWNTTVSRVRTGVFPRGRLDSGSTDVSIGWVITRDGVERRQEITWKGWESTTKDPSGGFNRWTLGKEQRSKRRPTWCDLSYRPYIVSRGPQHLQSLDATRSSTSGMSDTLLWTWTKLRTPSVTSQNSPTPLPLSPYDVLG